MPIFLHLYTYDSIQQLKLGYPVQANGVRVHIYIQISVQILNLDMFFQWRTCTSGSSNTVRFVYLGTSWSLDMGCSRGSFPCIIFCTLFQVLIGRIYRAIRGEWLLIRGIPPFHVSSDSFFVKFNILAPHGHISPASSQQTWTTSIRSVSTRTMIWTWWKSEMVTSR